MSTSTIIAKADELFRRYSPYEGTGLQNHCLRINQLLNALLQHDEIVFPRELIYLVAMLHDLGLVTDAYGGDNYLQRTCNLFRGETIDLNISAAQRATIEECLLFNHRLFRQHGCPEAKCMRQAIMIEHSRGLLRFGLEKSRVSEIFTLYPRDNFDMVLRDFARRVVLYEPQTILRGIFF